ncbi:MAG: DUF1501 domain-containing protein [Planctomycetaceae bacterium]|nr:DUF1501 domain-containing protein [Planctomycetaceae bacterium]
MTIAQERNHRSAPAITRRRLVEAGSLGLVGLSLPRLLCTEAMAGRASGEPRAKACLFIDQYGGASQVDTWDLKPEAPSEIRGPYQPIATSAPGVRVCELLPRLSAFADRFCLIRSMTHTDPNHDGGTHVALTGRSRPADDSPYFGSIVARFRPSEANLPSYVWLQNLDVDVKPRFRTGGFLGTPCAPLCVGEYDDNPSESTFRMSAFDAPGDVATLRLAARQRLLTGLDSSEAVTAGTVIDGYRRFQERAFDLVAGPTARRAFDLNAESAATRDRYGRTPLGQNLLMARRLIEAGTRLVTVNAWPGYPKEGKYPHFTEGWDMHGAAVQKCGIFSTGQFGLGFALPVFDQALSALLDDLDQSGLLDSTLVVVVGEFGRTPKIVNSPYPGRDHWPQCYSALVAGAGIRGGAVYGASDNIGAYVKDRPVSPEDFGATIVDALGIAPETRFGRDGFSEQVSAGQPLRELFG